ncbi:unnamed protein product [Moneuplotes crassus]|uniref:Uncharacterized protein n=1 Tax=Euplotes crassus TaxID=5936 RepID=A0AAD1UCQ8_EUPCR|nr:unnamed protein product [Moneuplotes crassus]
MSQRRDKNVQIVFQKRATRINREDEIDHEDALSTHRNTPTPLSLKIVRRNSPAKTPGPSTSRENYNSPGLTKFGKPHSKFLQKYFDLRAQTDHKLRERKPVDTRRNSLTNKPKKGCKTDSKVVPKNGKISILLFRIIQE